MKLKIIDETIKTADTYNQTYDNHGTDETDEINENECLSLGYLVLPDF